LQNRLETQAPDRSGGFQFERVDGMEVRASSWLVQGLLETDSFSCLFGDPGAVSLIDDVSMVSVVKALKVLIKELGRPPALAILDTWSRTLGGDDSAPSDAAAGVAALDALRGWFDNFAVLVVHHEGHTKGRGRGWSGLRAAVDMEFRAERGKDDLLRLECTKSKDTKPVDPMAFQFVGVALGITDEEGYPFTSAVLNRVDWIPVPEATGNKPAGKNQSLALDVLKRLEAEVRENRGDEGRVSLDWWREECKTEGIVRQCFYDVRVSLEKAGKIKVQDSFVCSVHPVTSVLPPAI
jgi:hypothetical protein